MLFCTRDRKDEEKCKKKKKSQVSSGPIRLKCRQQHLKQSSWWKSIDYVKSSYLKSEKGKCSHSQICCPYPQKVGMINFNLLFFLNFGHSLKKTKEKSQVISIKYITNFSFSRIYRWKFRYSTCNIMSAVYIRMIRFWFSMVKIAHHREIFY